MKTYKALIILAVCLGLLLVTIAGIAVAWFMAAGSGEEERNFGSLVDTVDKDIGAAYFARAAENLKTAFKAAKTKPEYLRLLKRAFDVDRYRENDLLLKEYAYTAWKKYPADENIAFIAAYAQMAGGNLVKAAEILKKAKKTEKLNRLRLQSELISGTVKEARALNVGEKISSGIRLLQADDPLLFKGIGEQLKDKRLLLDAALLYMYRGEPQAAYALAGTELFEENYDAPVAFIAYDNASPDTALSRVGRVLERTPDNAEFQALAGDLYFQTADYSAAKYSYLQALNAGQGDAPSLYLNLNWIYQYENRFDAAAVALDDGLAHFPTNPDLIYEKGKLLKRLTRYDEAVSLLSGLQGLQNADISLLLLDLTRKTMAPEQFNIKLWEIFQDNAANARICSALVTLLLRTNNAPDANTAMGIYRAASGIQTNAWLLHYEGLLAATGMQLEKAKELLTASMALEENRYVRYNLGVVQMFTKEFGQAAVTFREVLKNGQDIIENNSSFHSIIVMRIGEALAGQGDMRGALKQYLMAVEIDAENYHARLLSKKLDMTNE